MSNRFVKTRFEEWQACMQQEREARLKDPARRDGCQVCHGIRGGVPGNENVTDGILVCDYCSADRMQQVQKGHP